MSKDNRFFFNLLSSANRKGLHVALDEVHVLASPMEHFEAGIEFVEQGLAGTVKVIGNMQRAGGQSTKYLKAKYIFL